MNDKVGISLGANRVGLDYFHIKEYEKSIEYHKINISNTDEENCYAGFYNLGIT
jgi:hypothetical protein